MNIYLKILLIIIAANLLSGCARSSESDISISDTTKKLCEEAKYGKLNLSTVHNMEPLNNSHLFNCAVSVVVSFPDEKASSVKSRTEKKIKLADFFMSQDIDVNYKDESGGTLLMSVITSYMPSEWKVKAVRTLVSKGCDINEKNKYGKSAVDLAKFTEDSEIIKILLMYID